MMKSKISIKIDNETFNFQEIDSAVQFLKNAALESKRLAFLQSQKVIELRKKREKRDGYLNKSPIKIDAPSISVMSDGISGIHLDEIEQIKNMILDAYREAAQNAEIALLIQKSIELDNDEAMVLLLLE